MKLFLATILCTITLCSIAQVENFNIQYATYFGGGDFELARDLAIDADGNIYITGGTSSIDFPVTNGAYNIAYNNAGSSTVGNWGPMMVFVAKFSSTGELLWSTFLGGPNYDRAYAIEVDSAGYVYVGGRAGDDFPTTTGVFQEEFVQGNNINNLYGHQNGFISKLSPDGSELIWSTYYGGDSFGFFRDIDIDDEGYVYGILNGVLGVPAGISPSAFDTTHNGSYDMVPVKFNPDASEVIWASFLGGSGEDRGGPSIRVGADKSVFVAGGTQSTDFPTTANCAQPQHNGMREMFVARIAAEGDSLVYATYFGGSDDEYSETHSLYVDHLNQAYLACATKSDDILTTPGAIQQNITSTSVTDALFVKFSVDGGAVLACTYFGGSGYDGSEGLYVDSLQNLYTGGGTASVGLPTTIGAPQPAIGGNDDGFVIKVNPAFSEIKFLTYVGGSDNESVRAFNVTGNGKICISGQTTSGNFPLTADALQANHAIPNSMADSYLVIYSPADVVTEMRTSEVEFTIFPNPATQYIYWDSNGPGVESVVVYDAFGRESKRIGFSNAAGGAIDVRDLSPGHYTLQLRFTDGATSTKQFVKTL